MTRLRIFVSSVQKEFTAERKALADYFRGEPLMRRCFDVFLFEDLPASDRRADNVYIAEVERCDIYLALLGNDYGFEDAQGLSPTEREFIRATELGKPRFIYVKGTDDAARHPKMRKLVQRAGDELIRRRFGSTAELNTAVYASLIEHLERIGRLRSGPFDASACDGATLADISPERLSSFLDRAQSTRGYPLAPTTPVPDALTHLNLLDHGSPSHAAILLFGQDPQKWLPASIVKCLHFHGTEVRKPIPSHQEYRGTVFSLVDQAVDFVMSKIARQVGTRAEGNAAPVNYELPRDAVAEAIVNAIAHRDYSSNASVQVMLFSDRLEVWNPGELPPSLSPERLTKPHASIPRNPLLAGPLFLAGYVERAGTGTLDMIGLCRDAGLEPPEFRQDGGSFVQTLWRPAAQVTEQAAAQDKPLLDATLHSMATSLGIPTAQATAQAANQVWKVLLAADAPEGRTREELQAAADFAHREHFRKAYLDPLLSAGWLERTLPDKPTSPRQRYRLTAKGRHWVVQRSSALK